MDLILGLSLQFEPVQETNLFLLTLATFTGLWLTKKKKKKEKKLQRMILFRVVILNKLHPSLV